MGKFWYIPIAVPISAWGNGYGHLYPLHFGYPQYFSSAVMMNDDNDEFGAMFHVTNVILVDSVAVFTTFKFGFHEILYSLLNLIE